MKRNLVIVLIVLLALILTVFTACDKDVKGEEQNNVDGGTAFEVLPDGIYDGIEVSDGKVCSYSGTATDVVIPKGVTGILKATCFQIRTLQA